MTSDRLERAMLEPDSVFNRPEDILDDARLTNDQKVEVLRRWQYQAAEEAVALEEGMLGEESDLLRRILVEIGKVAAPLDLEHTSPTKQHGLSRDAIRHTK